MTKKRKLVTPVQVTRNNNNNKEIVILLTASNNRSGAAFEAFRILLAKKYFGYDISVFDQDLCKTLVIKYGLSCVDCNIKGCDIHLLEAAK